MSGAVRLATIAAAVGAAVSAGVFLAFSTFVMQALRELPRRDGMAAMQSINRLAPNPLFMLALFGTGALGVALVVVAVRDPDLPGALLWAAGAVYAAGLVLTVVYHVPHNDQLAAMAPSAPGAGELWVRYAGPWTAWNHVRTATSLLAAVLYTLALRR